MGRNLFTYALLGGIAEGAGAYAKGLSEERRMQQELEMRKLLQDDQQAFREQIGYGGRAPGSGSAGGRGAGAPAVTADQAIETADKILAQPSRERVAELYPGAPTQVDPSAYADGSAIPEGQAGPTIPWTDAEGKQLPARRVLDESFYKQKVDEIVRYRKVVYGGANADDMAKGEQTLAETNLLEKASRGDRKAGEGLLYAKGKDPVETEARADAQIAKADKDDRTDPNARRGGAGGGAPKAATVRSTKVDEQGNVIAVMSDGTTKPLGIKSDAFNARVAKVIGDMEKNDNKFAKLPADEKRRQAVQRLGAGGDAPAQSGTPAAGAVKALPAGAKQIGTSGGKPVYQTPDGKKFIQG